jgi:hypothetical protein
MKSVNNGIASSAGENIIEESILKAIIGNGENGVSASVIIMAIETNISISENMWRIIENENRSG